MRGVSKNHFVVGKVSSFDNDRIAWWPIFWEVLKKVG